MKPERILEIETEARRRLNVWLSNTTFNEMSAYGSKLRFEMALGLYGSPLEERENWLTDKECSRFVSKKEFFSEEVDNIIDKLFNELI